MMKWLMWSSIAVVAIFTSGFIGYVWWQSKHPIEWLNPQGDGRVLGTYTRPTDKIVYGFLPYWLLNQADYIQPEYLTHLAYFGVAIDEEGEIEERLEDGSYELGYRRLQTSETLERTLAKARAVGTEPVLVIRTMSNERIEAATDEGNQARLIKELIEMANQYEMMGFNIDLEPTGPADEVLQSRVTAFVQELNQACDQQIPNCHMTIDVYLSAADKPRIWNLRELAPHVDQIIIMGYDVHRPTSDRASPNAPIYGAPDNWSYDLQTSLNMFLDQVPAHKLILAVPYFGYSWPSAARTSTSNTSGIGSLVTYKRYRELVTDCQSDSDCSMRFDPFALSPVMSFSNQSGTSYEHIWAESRQSLEFKYLLAHDSGLAGVGIWALGYDAPYSDLWDLINTYLKMGIGDE